MYNQFILEEIQADSTQPGNAYLFEMLCMWVIIITGLCARQLLKDHRKDL